MTTGRAFGGLRGDGRGWLLVLIATGWLLTNGMRFVVPVFLPEAKVQFGINNTAAGFAVTIIWLTYAAVQFPAGVLTDRIGERTALVISLSATAASLVALSLAPVFAAFLVAAAVFGVAIGLYGPARAMALSNAFRRNDGAAFGITLAAGSFGGAALPFLASQLAARIGWQPTFTAAVPLFVATAVSLWLLGGRPERPPEASRPTPLAAILRDALAAVADRAVLLASAAAALMLFAYQGITAFLPTYLVATKAIDPATAAGLYALLFVSATLSRFLAGTAADRYGYRRVFAATAGVSVLPLLALPVASGTAVLAPLVLLLGVRLGTDPVSSAYIMRLLPADAKGAAWGCLRTALFGFSAIGSVFVGALADRGWFDEAFLAIAALTALAGVLFLLLPAESTATR